MLGALPKHGAAQSRVGKALGVLGGIWDRKQGRSYVDEWDLPKVPVLAVASQCPARAQEEEATIGRRIPKRIPWILSLRMSRIARSNLSQGPDQGNLLPLHIVFPSEPGDRCINHRRYSMPSKRELLKTNAEDKRYIRRDAQGRFTTDQSDVGRSLAADNNQKAKTNVPKGQGDRGDHRKQK